MGPCRILRKIFNNAYVHELPKGLDIFPTFDVVYFLEFHDGDMDIHVEIVDLKDHIQELDIYEIIEILKYCGEIEYQNVSKKKV